MIHILLKYKSDIEAEDFVINLILKYFNSKANRRYIMHLKHKT